VFFHLFIVTNNLKTKRYKKIEMVNYQLGKIYKIIDLETNECYIGSTCEPTLAQRLAKHVANHKAYIKGTGNHCTSYSIIEKDDYDIVLIETYPCNSRDELHARESHFTQTMTCVNKIKNQGIINEIVFEELQFFSEAEWRAVDSELKDIITSNYMSYVDNYEKRFDAENFCNFMVLTNFNAIKGANGRRYLALDMNASKMNDFKYFDYIRDNCFNKEFGEAFFSYLYEIDTSNFNSLDIPITKSKRDLCADLLSPLKQFLKFTYLLQKKSVNMKVKD
jgi:hypothetical protein